MPILPPVGNVLKIALKGFVDGFLEDVWENVFHWRWTGTSPTSGTLQNIAGGIANSWQTHMAPEAPSPVTLQQVTATDLTSDTSQEGVFTAVVPGSRGDDSLPAQTAALISYPINLRYRGGHPRTYLLVGGTADIAGATEWSTAFTAEFRQHWVDFLNAVAISSVGGTSLGNMCAVLYHGHGGPYSEGTLRVNPIVVDINQNQAIASGHLATQRRRVKLKSESSLARSLRVQAQINGPAI